MATVFQVPAAPLDVTFYQCTRCRYTSAIRHNVTTHVSTVAACAGAEVCSEKCTCPLMPLGSKAPAAVVHVEGDNSGSIQQNHIVVNVHPNLVYVGSEEERAALFAIFQDPEALRELANREPEEIPATLFRLWKGADAPPVMKNIRVQGDKVQEVRGPNQVTVLPRTKFLKRTVSDMLGAAGAAGPEATRAAVAQPEFKVGKQRRVSRLEAARMHADGSREVYAMDSAGRRFLNEANDTLDRELAYC